MTAAALVPPATEKPLPRLRRDLQIELVAEAGRKLPFALVRDPVRAAYFRLAWPHSAVFATWQHTSSQDALRQALARELALEVASEDIEQVAEFAVANELTEASTSWRGLAARRLQRRQHPLVALIHGYLFFRIPLLHPQAALIRALPWFGFVFTPAFWFGVAALGLFGLYLAMRAWSEVVAAAAGLFAVETLAVYGVAVLMLKGVHEFGHALTTVRQGCRVPSMGVAIMFGAPVFYTDTTDSWRLSARRQRLAIVLAGVAAETVVAVAALLAWCVLPDGPIRDICFALATASLVLTLTVNLNPFMRFDGYYALSDALAEPNLQPRAFALARWWLREFLFGLGHAPPEALPRSRRAVLIRYGMLTALYRFVLFIGIAAMVYVIAGKAFGIVLAAIEVGLLILKPIFGEFAIWWRLRRDILGSVRSAVTVTLLTLVVGVMATPWIATVEAPSVIVARREAPIHLPFAARLESINVQSGQRVAAGDVLLVARAPDLERDLARAKAEAEGLAQRQSRLVVSASDERELGTVIGRELARARESIAAVERRLAQLTVTAPFAGSIRDVDPQISAGLWLGADTPLMRLVDGDAASARGMVAETDVARIKAGAAAVFIADDPLRPRQTLQVLSIAPASDGRFAEPALASVHGGGVLSGAESGEDRARHGMFEVTFAPLAEPAPIIVRGLAWIDADRVSPMTLLWRRIARVLVREQGF